MGLAVVVSVCLGVVCGNGIFASNPRCHKSLARLPVFLSSSGNGTPSGRDRPWRGRARWARVRSRDGDVVRGGSINLTTRRRLGYGDGPSVSSVLPHCRRRIYWLREIALSCACVWTRRGWRSSWADWMHARSTHSRPGWPSPCPHAAPGAQGRQPATRRDAGDEDAHKEQRGQKRQANGARAACTCATASATRGSSPSSTLGAACTPI